MKLTSWGKKVVWSSIAAVLLLVGIVFLREPLLRSLNRDTFESIVRKFEPHHAK